MNDIDKLRSLIPHWIEHNEEHASEFRRWAELETEASADILAAAENIELANLVLTTALEKLGGVLAHKHELHG